jgi:hypothetical protein
VAVSVILEVSHPIGSDGRVCAGGDTWFRLSIAGVLFLVVFELAEFALRASVLKIEGYRAHFENQAAIVTFDGTVDAGLAAVVADKSGSASGLPVLILFHVNEVFLLCNLVLGAAVGIAALYPGHFFGEAFWYATRFGASNKSDGSGGGKAPENNRN